MYQTHTDTHTHTPLIHFFKTTDLFNQKEVSARGMTETWEVGQAREKNRTR